MLQLVGSDGYEYLRSAIVKGELMPGERLLEEELSSRLGVGRAAVRTALIRLEHDGLVQRERNRGARVRRISEHEAVEILEARAALEGLAARHAAINADDSAIDELRAILAEMQRLRENGDFLGVSNANARLHARILELSGHTTARRLSQTLTSQLVRFQYRTVLLPGRAVGSYAEHTEIVEAIAAHDAEGAEAAMRCHLSRVAAALRAHHDGESPPAQVAKNPAQVAKKPAQAAKKPAQVASKPAQVANKPPRRRARRAVSDR